MKSMKPCTSIAACSALWDVEKRSHVDRLSTLPDELLLHILSLIPTKDAAATSVLSTRLRLVFPFIPNLDLDVSPISLCVNHPHVIEKYPTFVTFVTNVIQAHQSDYLTRFRLDVGTAKFSSWYTVFCNFSRCCKQTCLPDLNGLQLSAWIAFPLTHHGLRELDLCILVREPTDVQLPPAIFTCQTLEVLKLKVNIGLNEVLAMPSYSLPRLKLLFFSMCFVSDDSFLPRLLASCPLLEDLLYEPFTEHVDHLIIQSTSLRRLCVRMHKVQNPAFDFDNSDFVYIDTPNLEHFEYDDNLAFHYSIPIIHNCLVEATIRVWHVLPMDGPEVDFLLLLNLIRPVSYVQQLYLSGRIFQVFSDVDLNLQKDQLPIFPNMKHLALDGDLCKVFWDKILLPLLNCWPVLETLVFVKGIIDDCDYCVNDQMLEQNFFRATHPIPSCFRYHLKTIEIKKYFVKQRELEFIQFVLRHALVLENLIVHRSKSSDILALDKMSLESTLRSLQKASVSCSIQVL